MVLYPLRLPPKRINLARADKIETMVSTVSPLMHTETEDPLDYTHDEDGSARLEGKKKSVSGLSAARQSAFEADKSSSPADMQVHLTIELPDSNEASTTSSEAAAGFMARAVDSVGGCGSLSQPPMWHQASVMVAVQSVVWGGWHCGQSYHLVL